MSLLFILLVLHLVPGSRGEQLFAQVPRLFDPLTESSAYDLIAAFALRHDRDSFFITAKPWSSRDVANFLETKDSTADLASASWMRELLRTEVRFSEAREEGHAGISGIEHLLTTEMGATVLVAGGRSELHPGFQSIRRRRLGGEPDIAGQGELRLGYAWLPGGLSAVADLRVRTNTRNEFDFRDRSENGAVDVRSAYLLWQNPRFLISAGRLPVEWGNGPLGGVGLTAVGPSLDGFLARARWPSVQVSLLSAFLPNERANRVLDPNGNTIASSAAPTDEAPLVDRYLFGHRVDVRIGKGLTIGVNEMAVLTGVRRTPDLQFLLGLVPYVVAQNSREEIDRTDINLGAGIQYRWRWPGRVLLYGEYFANEIFLDSDLGAVVRGLRGRGRNTQGFQQGFRWGAPFGWESVDFEAEVVRLEPFLYLHRGLNTNWRLLDAPLGAPLGPDNQRVLARIRAYRAVAGGLLTGSVGLSYRKRGSGRITHNDDIESFGMPISIPREPVETSWLGTVEAELWWPRRSRLGISMTVGRVDVANNIPGQQLTPFDLELYMKLGSAWDHAF